MGIIRFLLAVAVLNSHYPVMDWDLPMVDGHEAVLTFFAISGFFMALILDTTYKSRRYFYVSRFLTLYPIYVFAVLLSVGLLASLDIHPVSSRADTAAALSDPASFLALAWTTICVWGQELLFSFGPAQGGGLAFVTDSRHGLWWYTPLIQAWSLSLEMTFYALAPFLVRWKSNKLILFLAASLVLKICAMAWFGDIVLFKRFFPLEFWLFAGGILAYRTYKLLPRESRPTDGLCLAALVAGILLADLVPTWAEPFCLPVLALVCMPFVFRLLGSFRADKILGRITYPFYLLHFSVIAVFEHFFEEPTGWDILLTTFVMAMIAYHLFTPGTEMLKRQLAARFSGPPEAKKSFILP